MFSNIESSPLLSPITTTCFLTSNPALYSIPYPSHPTHLQLSARALRLPSHSFRSRIRVHRVFRPGCHLCGGAGGGEGGIKRGSKRGCLGGVEGELFVGIEERGHMQAKCSSHAYEQTQSHARMHACARAPARAIFRAYVL